MITTSGGQVLFEVDATTLHSNKKLRRIGFDVIVFMFPHVGAGIKDKVRNIRANQELLSGFFSSAQQVLRVDNPTAGLHIAIKTTPPYDEWDIKAQARANGLVCARSCVFDADVFPGYGHRRTIGFEEGLSKGNNEELQGKQCRVFMFEQKQETS
jgi:25S rRNA (uracil2634-N3)-methyltransferase